jgi:hypothetical protein
MTQPTQPSMKFDVVVGNPPYQGTLCLKFLHQACEIGEHVLYVMPTTWLLDKKHIYKPYESARVAVGDRLQHVTLFNGNEQFGIDSFLPLGVFDIAAPHERPIEVIDRCNNMTLTYNSIDDINKFSDTVVFPNLADKYVTARDRLGHVGLHTQTNGSFFVNFSPIRGHVNNKGSKMVADDFYTMVTRDLKVERSASKKRWWSFNTQQEADNFLSYLKTDFARFGLAIYKNTQNLGPTDMACIPWLDFTRSWSDKQLYDMFGITSKEQVFIKDNIPLYYT